MSDSRQIVEAFMGVFVESWPGGDAGRVASFFSHDAVYHNIPLAPVHGRTAIEAALAEMMRLGGRVDVDVRHVVVDGPLVMVERVDHFVAEDGATVSLPVAGAFDVREGLIRAWRDYFDLAPVLSLGASASQPR